MNGENPSQCSLLVLPDGSLLVRNLTPDLSALLMAIQPGNSDLALRVTASESTVSQQTTLPDP